MDVSLTDERNKLQEDEEKLQTALQELSDQWDSDLESEEDEDEDQLAIDLDYEPSAFTGTAQSAQQSAIGNGTASHSQSNTFGDDDSGEPVPRPSIGLPSQIDTIAQRSGPEKTLALNQALQGILEGHIEAIQEALAENREKQERLEEDASEISTKQKTRGPTKGPFRAPYFRDDTSSYPEANEDVIMKNQGNEFARRANTFKDSKLFQKKSKALLREAVIEDQLERLLKPLITKMEIEIEKRDTCATAMEDLSSQLELEKEKKEDLNEMENSEETRQERKEALKREKEVQKKLEEEKKKEAYHKDQITQLEQEIEQKRNTSEDELLASVDSEKVDWMKISKMNFGGKNSWLDCQKAWENLVSSKINSGQWKPDEDTKLKELVAESETGNWIEIAKKLNNGRTPFQCFSHYQSCFNSELRPKPWTQEEDAKLINVATKIKEGMGFYSWRKVCALMERRSPIECMSRFSKISPTIRHGKWSDIEDAKLVTAVETLGHAWSKVAKFLETRNMIQCRDRYMNCLAPNINFTRFTYDEDAKLLRLHKQMGTAWAKMVPKFRGRTDSMLLARYKQLQKWKRQTEWFRKQTPETKKMLLGRSLMPNYRKKMEMRLKDYLAVQHGIKMEDYKRQELDKDNGVDPQCIPPRPPMHLKYFDAGNRKKGLLSKWRWKLDLHKRLSDSMHRLLEREAKKTKSKGPQPIPEEVTEELMEENIQETAKSGNNPTNLTKSQVKNMESALNKAFLSGGTVSVQELLNASLHKKPRKRKLPTANVDTKLKSALHKSRRLSSKVGRGRRFFERDTRPASVIEAELDELDSSVPLMLMKSLGTDVDTLYNSAKLKMLEIQEQLANFSSYIDDPAYKSQVSETKTDIEKFHARTDISDSYRQNRLSLLSGKLKKLKKVFQEKYDTEKRTLESEMTAIQDDMEYLEGLRNAESEAEIDRDLSLLVCNSNGDTDTVSEVNVRDNPLPSCSSISSVLSKSGMSKDQETQNLTSVSKSSLESNAVCSSEALEKNKNSVNTRSTRSKGRNRSSTTNKDEERYGKKIKLLSKEEIAEERQKITNMSKKIFSNLPLLPPNYTTLMALKALLLMRGDLILKADNSYQAKRYQRKNKTVDVEIDIAEEDGGDEIEYDNTNGDEENNPEMFGSWFQPSTPQHLSEQARQFQGFEKRGRRVAFHPKFDSVTQEPSFRSSVPPARRIVPEELDRFDMKMNRLPAHSPSQDNYSFDGNVDIKPTVPLEAKKASTYEVIMAPAGNIKNIFPPTSTSSVVPSSMVSTSTSVCSSIELSQQHSTTNVALSSSASNENIRSSNDNSNFLVSRDVSSVRLNPDMLSFPHGVENYLSDDNRERNNEIYTDNISALSGTDPEIKIDNRSSINIPLEQNNMQQIDQKNAITVIPLNSDGSRVSSYIRISSNDNNQNLTSNQTNNSSRETNNERIMSVIPVNSDDDGSDQGTEAQYRKNGNSELDDLELPSVKLKRLIERYRLKNQESEVVVVDVIKDTNKIVHFKSEENKFKAYETIGTDVAENPIGKSRSQMWEERKADERKKAMRLKHPDHMKSIREMDEYKLLLARFKSLLMWPVLISTVQPSVTTGENVSEWILKGKPEEFKISKGPKKRRSAKSQLKHLKEARKVARDNKEKKNPVLPTVAEQEDIEGGEPKKKRGRPKGAKTKKTGVVIPVDRPRRNVRKTVEEPVVVTKKEEEPSLHTRIKPQWWKDAVLAAMMSKKAQKEDGEANDEIPIEEDEDFIDKGNYSDDEWVQELRAEEAKKQSSDTAKTEEIVEEIGDINETVSD